jgi:hypothetical protein
LGVALVIARAAAAGEPCADDVRKDQGYTIRRSYVEGWWPPEVELPTGPYSSATESEAIHRVDDALQSTRFAGPAFLSSGTVSLAYTDTCVRKVDEATCRADVGTTKCVDLAVRPHTLRVDLIRYGDNVLPIPRLNRPIDVTRAAAPLRLLHPALGASFDRSYGPAASWGLATEALSALGMLGASERTAGPFALEIATAGRKSLDERFYETHNEVRIATQQRWHAVRGAALDGAFTAEDEPLGDGHVERLLGYGGGSVSLRPDSGWLKRVALDGRYRWAHIRRRSSTVSEDRTDHAALGHAAFEAFVADTLARVAVWGDYADPNGDHDTYQRAVAFAGIARDIPLALNQTIGVELVGALGKAWGEVPGDARFYAGNSQRNFLYDGIDGAAAVELPSGPLMRNLGEGQAGVRTRRGVSTGGTAFWNVSLTASFPDSVPLTSADSRRWRSRKESASNGH